MPRKPRMYLPDVPAHVVQRGNNRNACFFHTADYRYYLAVLQDALERHQVALHAYVLMSNHVHLLLTPRDADGISRVLQRTGLRYVRRINAAYGRTGTLWEGRHKASLVDAEDYLLACYRYIELNPVRAGIVAVPEAYPWSSYRCHAWGEPDALVTDHAVYTALAEAPDRRQHMYRQLFRGRVADEALVSMRTALSANYPLGNDRFRESIMRQLGRPLGQPGPGRPRRQTG